MFLMCYLRVISTDSGHIPDNHIWNINIPANVPIEIQTEYFAMIIDQREEHLESHRNLIGNETTQMEETISTQSNQIQ